MRVRLRGLVEAAQARLDSQLSPAERLHYKSNEKVLFGIRYLTIHRLSSGTMCLSIEASGAHVDIGRPPGHLFRLRPRASRAAPKGEILSRALEAGQQQSRPGSQQQRSLSSNHLSGAERPNSRSPLLRLKTTVVYPEIETVIETLRAKHRPRVKATNLPVPNRNSGISWFKSPPSVSSAGSPSSPSGPAVVADGCAEGSVSSTIALGGGSECTLASAQPSASHLDMGELQHHLMLARQRGEDVVSLISQKSAAR